MTTVACKSDQSAGSLGNLIRVLGGVEDPRMPRRRLHSLEKILLIALFATAGGALSWRQVREFGRLHQGWFALHVDMSTGIPCHDTFRRVFGLLLPEATQRLLKGFFENKGVSAWNDREETANVISADCPETQIATPTSARACCSTPSTSGIISARDDPCLRCSRRICATSLTPGRG